MSRRATPSHLVTLCRGLAFTVVVGCVPQFPQTDFPEDPSHDYDHDGQTETRVTVMMWLQTPIWVRLNTATA